MPEEDRRVRMPDTLDALDPITVLRYQIDTNEHVNNSQYVQMALELLPRDIEHARVRVDYKHAAVLGDTIYPRSHARRGAPSSRSARQTASLRSRRILVARRRLEAEGTQPVRAPQRDAGFPPQLFHVGRRLHEQRPHPHPRSTRQC